MLTLVLLIAWIAGISSMGRVLPDYVQALANFVYFIALLLLGFKLFKLSFLKAVYFDWILVIFLTFSLFFLGQHYAQHCLQERLKQRFSIVEDTSQIVYIKQLNQLSDQNSIQSIKQLAVLAPSLQNFNINSLDLSQAAEQQNNKILLYLSADALNSTLVIGHYYRVSGKIKPAHSYAIANVFDQEKWLIQQNIMATMQVSRVEELKLSELQLMGYSSFVKHNSGWRTQFINAAEQQRLNFRLYIQKQSYKNKGLLLALLTGDESLLSDSTKAQFKTLGISHLLAISGPHVLIFAALFCFVFNAIVSKFKPSIFQYIPRPYLLIFPFLICVLLYAAFVGFEIPAMRTLLTVCIVSLALLIKQQIHALKLLMLSASILLLLDPFGILSAAFWLSYGACFILIRVYQTMSQQKEAHSATVIITWKSKAWLFFKTLFDSQWKVFIALFPLVAVIFQQLSWISPLVNLIAIPLIGVVIVPLEIIAAILSLLSEPAGVWVFHFADWALSFLLLIFKVLEAIFNPSLSWLSLSTVSILSIAVGILILFLPRLVLPKMWALLCFLPAFLMPKNQHEFSLTVLDVGQGQAIHLQTEQQHIMIDTGGYYDENKFSVGRQLIIPYLMAKAISSLDQVYLSHLDQDHAGAFSEINKQITLKKVFSNEYDARFDGLDFDYCYSGQYQQLAAIKLTVLAPEKSDLIDQKHSSNELSCVIYIQVPQSLGHKSFLIMGDVGWSTEYQLLQKYPDLTVDVLILGHHGSRHSSSYDFLRQLKPKLAIVSAGFNNRYNHPHPLVKARLEQLSIPFKTTIQQGSIQFSMDKKGHMQIDYFRDSKVWLKR